MALNDILPLDEPQFGSIGTRKWAVTTGATTINPGEPVVMTLGGTSVTVGGRDFPSVGTDYLVGVAASTSTQTASADGTVEVTPLVPGQIWLIAPTTAASWDTQYEYDQLVGDRVLLDLTAGTYTIAATDSTTNGLVIEPLDIAKHSGKVAFSFRAATNYLNAWYA